VKHITAPRLKRVFKKTRPVASRPHPELSSKKGFPSMECLPHAEPTARAKPQVLSLVPKPGSACTFTSAIIPDPQKCSDQRYCHRRALRIARTHRQTGSTATYSMNMKLPKTRLLPTKSSLHNYSPYIDHDSLAHLPLSRVRIETNLPSSFLFVE
jgi:hypothetical protein